MLLATLILITLFSPYLSPIHKIHSQSLQTNPTIINYFIFCTIAFFRVSIRVNKFIALLVRLRDEK